MIWKRVCILGVGLLGGSIGMRLRQDRLAHQVVGHGRDLARLTRARDLGAIDLAETSVALAAQDADLIIACTPVQQIASGLVEAAQYASPAALLTDVGSTKLRIVEAMRKSPWKASFIGSHPLAGSDRSGVEFAHADLFESRLVMVTPTDDNSPESMDRVEGLWRSIGANVVRLTAADHDEAMAMTSHLPHVVASMLAANTPEALLPMTGSGWRDSTRIGAGSPALWRQILEENQAPVLHALKKFATISQTWIEAIEAGDFERVEELLKTGKRIRDIVGSRHSSG